MSEQRLALAIVARSPSPRIVAYGRRRGWKHLRRQPDVSGDSSEGFVGERDADMPGYTVFQRTVSTIRPFCSTDDGSFRANPCHGPRDASDMTPLSIVLDTTPEGRGTGCYPRLDDRNRRYRYCGGGAAAGSGLALGWKACSLPTTIQPCAVSVTRWTQILPSLRRTRYVVAGAL